MEQKSGSLWEWVIPAAFFFCFAWIVWHLPAFFLDLFPPESESLLLQVSAIYERADITPNLPPIMGGFSDFFDWIMLLAIPVLGFFGVRTVRKAGIEYEDWRAIDRVAVFLGRVTMMMIIAMTAVMLYEVFVRYVVERPTIWANELTLWIAGFVFLLAGLYAMQQRSHIRIVLLYDVMPRNVQRTFDVISTAMIVLFAAATVFGSYKQAFINKLYKWELYGSAFNPPIPATLQPMVVVVITLVAVQAVINLISDWNQEQVDHAVVEIDEEELEAIRKSLGTK